MPDEWRSLPPAVRAVVFAATLMHDVAKPLRTREEPMARLVVSDLHPA